MAAAARHRRFQTALWRVYRMDESLRVRPTGDTVMCRCEEVTCAQVEAALAAGAKAPGEIKQETRLGMGRCQARYCGPVLETFLADHRKHFTKDSDADADHRALASLCQVLLASNRFLYID